MTKKPPATHPRFNVQDWDGKPITKSGIFKGVPISFYHGGSCCDGPSISSSGLRTIFSKSPAHFYDESPLNPARAQRDDKDFFTLGRAAHHLLFGEKLFSQSFLQQPTELPDPKTGEVKPWQGNRTVCREWMEQARKTGKDVVTADMLERVRGMAVSLGRHPFVRDGILRGLVEMTLAWKDKETGIWLRSRPDAIPTDSADICDLKTTADIFRINYSIKDYRYDMQAALARMACREVLGIEMSSFTLMFVESNRPFTVETRQLGYRDLDEAEKDIKVALRIFASCLKSGDWFGPGGTRRDAGTAYFSERDRENATFRREELEREIATK